MPLNKVKRTVRRSEAPKEEVWVPDWLDWFECDVPVGSLWRTGEIPLPGRYVEFCEELDRVYMGRGFAAFHVASARNSNR